jgi:predicted kinase
VGILVVVSGLPGSGKSSLARQLGMAVIERDRLAEVCFDALGGDRTAPLGHVSYELLFHVAREFLASGAPLVVESNFSRARHANQLTDLVSGTPYRLAEIHCTSPGDVLLNRYATRAVSGQRHPRHNDANRIEEFRAIFASPARHEDALIFPDLALVVDTTRPTPMDAVRAHVAQRRATFGPPRRSAQ